MGGGGGREPNSVCLCVSSRAGPSAAGTPPWAMSTAARCTFASLSKVREALFAVPKWRTGSRQFVGVERWRGVITVPWGWGLGLWLDLELLFNLPAHKNKIITRCSETELQVLRGKDASKSCCVFSGFYEPHHVISTESYCIPQMCQNKVLF